MMADKKISDFATLSDIQSNDLLLVSSLNETYNVKAETLINSLSDNVIGKIDIHVFGTQLVINIA